MDVREERFLATKPLINGFGGAVDCLKLLPNEDACHPVCFSPERLSESRLDEEGVRNFSSALIPKFGDSILTWNVWGAGKDFATEFFEVLTKGAVLSNKFGGVVADDLFALVSCLSFDKGKDAW